MGACSIGADDLACVSCACNPVVAVCGSAAACVKSCNVDAATVALRTRSGIRTQCTRAHTACALLPARTGTHVRSSVVVGIVAQYVHRERKDGKEARPAATTSARAGDFVSTRVRVLSVDVTARVGVGVVVGTTLLLANGAGTSRVEKVAIAVGSGGIALRGITLLVDPDADVIPVWTRFNRSLDRHGDRGRTGWVTRGWSVNQSVGTDSDIVGGAGWVAANLFFDAGSA